MSKREFSPSVVGIGASAGGIEALRGLFQSLPATGGLAYVVVTHMNPERDSLLHEIIGRYTTMPVSAVRSDVAVEPDTVYVMIAGTVLSMRNGELKVRVLEPGQREPKPVDVFLASLAQDLPHRSAGIILSGGDGDGSLGIKAIKARGGLTMAQSKDGEGPRHPDMPESAVATGMIDFAIPVEEMGAKLAAFARAAAKLDPHIVSDPRDTSFKPSKAEIEAIYALLRKKVGHDFAGYKENTFLRRVHRRMQLINIATTSAYIEHLTASAEEVRTLFHDLLINVTAFFRDPAAFQALSETVIPKLFEGRDESDTVRVWVPGCATGEEVYSIAILLLEHMATLTEVPSVQIFATDIDEKVLSIARAGRYPATLLSDVSPARLRQFFRSDGASFVVNKTVRDLCNFSPHSVLRDPPFSRIDFVSCRNLLIYFGVDAQAHVIPTFHYALRPSGYLFLGPSENVSQFGELFVPLDKKHRIFSSRIETRPVVKLPGVITGLRALPASEPKRVTPKTVTTIAELRSLAEMRVLERFAPPHVIVNADGDVVHFSARTGRYLEPSVGVPNRQLLGMARKGLRLDLRTAFREAIETGRTATRTDVSVEIGEDQVQQITLTIEPFNSRGEDGAFYLILFIDEGEPQRGSKGTRGAVDPVAVQLERELHDTRDRLQSVVEEYETALEELKSSNEELVSLNEELQSSNEEMEASKEELQSLNEELHTVNAELNGKVEALDVANADLHNLFESSRVATIFLDKDLVIRSFTPAASDIFNVRPGDHGRPLTELSSRIVLPTLREDVNAVFRDGQVLERQISHDNGRQYFLIRMAPYVSLRGKMEGVVLTFVDVTSLTRAEAQQRLLNLELNHRVKNMLAVVIGIARQMERSESSAKVASRTFVNRLLAMSRGFEILSHENWTGARVADLVRQEVGPVSSGRITFEGPDVRLLPNQALSLSMVLHELTMNAVNHGALLGPTGKISISWQLGQPPADSEMTLRWVERTESPMTAPAHHGFGLKIVEREGAYNLGGKTKIEFSKHGLDVMLSFPTTGQLFGGI
jgi:two-component system CheB/CheR fusion protein